MDKKKSRSFAEQCILLPMLDNPGEDDAHGTEKLLLDTHVTEDFV